MFDDIKHLLAEPSNSKGFICWEHHRTVACQVKRIQEWIAVVIVAIFVFFSCWRSAFYPTLTVGEDENPVIFFVGGPENFVEISSVSNIKRSVPFFTITIVSNDLLCDSHSAIGSIEWNVLCISAENHNVGIVGFRHN